MRSGGKLHATRGDCSARSAPGRLRGIGLSVRGHGQHHARAQGPGPSPESDDRQEAASGIGRSPQHSTSRLPGADTGAALSLRVRAVLRGIHPRRERRGFHARPPVSHLGPVPPARRTPAASRYTAPRPRPYVLCAGGADGQPLRTTHGNSPAPCSSDGHLHPGGEGEPPEGKEAKSAGSARWSSRRRSLAPPRACPFPERHRTPGETLPPGSCGCLRSGRAAGQGADGMTCASSWRTRSASPRAWAGTSPRSATRRLKIGVSWNTLESAFWLTRHGNRRATSRSCDRSSIPCREPGQ